MSGWGKEDSARGLFGQSQAAERVAWTGITTGPLWEGLGTQWAGPDRWGGGAGLLWTGQNSGGRSLSSVC